MYPGYICVHLQSAKFNLTKHYQDSCDDCGQIEFDVAQAHLYYINRLSGQNANKHVLKYIPLVTFAFPHLDMLSRENWDLRTTSLHVISGNDKLAV